MSYQISIFEGKVGRDAEMRYTPTGQAVTSFSVAVNDEYTTLAGEKVKDTLWIRVTVWGKLAEVCNQYVKKGKGVLVEGKLKGGKDGNPKIFNKSDGTASASFELTANTVRFLSPATEGEKTQNAAPAPAEEDFPF